MALLYTKFSSWGPASAKNEFLILSVLLLAQPAALESPDYLLTP